MISEITGNWLPILSTIVSMIGVGYGVRRLETMIKHRKSEEKGDIYNRISAIESEQSGQRSDIMQINNSYKELREGCQVLEGKIDTANNNSIAANTRSKTVIEMVKKIKP